MGRHGSLIAITAMWMEVRMGRHGSLIAITAMWMEVRMGRHESLIAITQPRGQREKKNVAIPRKALGRNRERSMHAGVPLGRTWLPSVQQTALRYPSLRILAQIVRSGRQVEAGLGFHSWAESSWSLHLHSHDCRHRWSTPACGQPSNPSSDTLPSSSTPSCTAHTS
jgi:hypothetical protein